MQTAQINVQLDYHRKTDALRFDPARHNSTMRNCAMIGIMQNCKSITKMRNHVSTLRCFKISAPILCLWGITSQLYHSIFIQNIPPAQRKHSTKEVFKRIKITSFPMKKWSMMESLQRRKWRFMVSNFSHRYLCHRRTKRSPQNPSG